VIPLAGFVLEISYSSLYIFPFVIVLVVIGRAVCIFDDLLPVLTLRALGIFIDFLVLKVLLTF